MISVLLHEVMKAVIQTSSYALAIVLTSFPVIVSVELLVTRSAHCTQVPQHILMPQIPVCHMMDLESPTVIS